MIRSPKLPLSHPGRPLECELAMEEENYSLLDRGLQVRNEEFRMLAERARAAGWTGDEIGAAMISLAEKYVAVKARQNASSADERKDPSPDA